MGILHRIAQRCETHDRYSYTKTRSLEDALGMEPSPAPESVVDAFCNPDIIECGNAWCRSRS